MIGRDYVRKVVWPYAYERTLVLGVFKYRHVRDILLNNRDQVDVDASDPGWTSPLHPNLRGPGHYQ